MSDPAYTSLEAIHDAIKQKVRDHWEGQSNTLETVEEYNPFEYEHHDRLINSPAVLLEVQSFDYGDKDGSGRTPLVMDLALHPVLSRKTPRVQVEIRQFAAEVCRLIEQEGLKRWGLGSACDAPGNISAQPAFFSPEKSGYESWVVSWSQTFYISNADSAVWPIPDTLYASVAPELGPDYKPDYQQLTGFDDEQPTPDQ